MWDVWTLVAGIVLIAAGIIVWSPGGGHDGR